MAFELYGAGEIVQGVRGEGKSLYAVGRIKEYMLRGCSVATNLDLFLENLLPNNNGSIAYRLPDKPRIEDFEVLPPAADLDYKLADKNGLIVLDELGLWLNCRNWNDKGRQRLIDWLLLSRKRHWDLLLLVQDVEMVDGQIKTTLCDYLVQASRTDRQKIPYVASLIEFLGFRAFFPKFHIYEGYYGLSFADKPQFVRRFRGVDLYEGYNTNQLFVDGVEVIEIKERFITLLDGSQEFVTGRVFTQDMRATYTFLPVCYLTRQIYVDRLQAQIDKIENLEVLQVDDMATKKKSVSGGIADKMKIAFILIMVAAYFTYRFYFSAVPVMSTANASVLSPANQPIQQSHSDSVFSVPSAPLPVASAVESKPVKKEDFISRLVDSYRPRLAGELVIDRGKPTQKYDGIIEFYEGSTFIQRFTFKELKAFKVVIVSKGYGVDMVTDAGVFPVTRWDISHDDSQVKKI